MAPLAPRVDDEPRRLSIRADQIPVAVNGFAISRHGVRNERQEAAEPDGKLSKHQVLSREKYCNAGLMNSLFSQLG